MVDRWRLPARRIEDGLLVTDHAVWAYFTVPTQSLEYSSADQQAARAQRVADALAALRNAELHLHIVPRHVDLQAWARRLDRPVDSATPGWSRYLQHHVDHLTALRPTSRTLYLGVKLHARGSDGLAGWRQRLRELLGLDDPAADTAVDEHIRRTAEQLGRQLAAEALTARPASAAELHWLVQRCWWRGIGSPPQLPRRRWGRGQLSLLADSVIDHRWRQVVLDQATGRSHLAWLAAARLPEELPVPGAPWLACYEQLDFPVELSVRMQVVPPHEARRDVARRLAGTVDQALHVHDAGSSPPLDVIEAHDVAKQLQHAISKNRTTLVYSWPRWGVWGADEDELADRITRLIALYRDHDVELVRPTGSQLRLTMEATPGAELQVGDYGQQTDTLAVAAGTPTAAVELGDGVGPYIGRSLDHGGSPVHFDPLTAAGRNRGTVAALCGAPGAGKTTAAYLMAYQAALRGVPVLIVDPKSEGTGFLESPGVGHTELIRLGAEHAGLLDPYRLADGDAAAQLAADTLRSLVPAAPSNDEEAVLVAATVAESHADHPTLLGAVRRLHDSRGAVDRRLATGLSQYQGLPAGRLIFAAPDPAPERLTLQPGITLLQIGGMRTPDPATPHGEMHIGERLAAVLIQLVGHTCHELASRDEGAKLIVLDEAWALTATTRGRKLINEIGREGRSRNTALLLLSQRASDMLPLAGVQTGISAVLAGRQERPDAEVDATCELLQIDPTERHRHAIRTLHTGEFLMRDADGRVGAVRIDLASRRLAELWDTNPGRHAAQQQAAVR